jgi:hypothetical protein
MWVFIGLIGALVFLALAWWFRRHNTSLTWYEWLIGALGVVLLFFTMQNYFASVAELEPFAPGMFLLVFGIPALVLILIALLLPLWRYFRSARRDKQTGEAAT